MNNFHGLMDEFLVLPPLFGLVCAVGIWWACYHHILDADYSVCVEYADAHDGHVEEYVESMYRGTSFPGYRVSLPNGSYITAEEIRRISSKGK